ncbi:unnamed protein product [Prorocentrum cordatum]|uniref:Uncharacterized protein n=1 Tax=Prorocentrum cordatum TaxID=2364126 RepID=A0ABN9RPR0_9DINO|nr:unnamed protein product [Polarella glacialis]
MGQHMEDFGRALAENCRRDAGAGAGAGPGCVGTGWNLSAAEVLRFPRSAGSAAEIDGAGFDFVVSAERPFGPFETRSRPPTFLLVVEPRPPHEHVGWTATLRPSKSPSSRVVSGRGRADKVVVGRRQGSAAVSWTGRMRLETGVSAEAEVRVSVVDSRVEHLQEIHKQRQCSFEKSWEAFSMRKGGEHLVVLQRTRYAVASFLLFSICLMATVLHRLCSRRHSGSLLKRAIMLKFVAQDFPQQICIVAYLYSWYAKNGLRCQMCLFNPLHCETQQPLHWSNFLLCLVTALSAVSNQLLIQAKVFQDILDDCFVIVFRVALLSFSVLPFSTAVYLSPLCFHYDHMLVLLLSAVLPFVLGWMTVCCGWMFVVFRDELDL